MLDSLDKKSYLSDFKVKFFWIWLSIWILVVIDAPWIHSLLLFIVNTTFKYIEERPFFNVLIFVLFLCALIQAIRSFIKGTIPTINSLQTIFSVWLIYLLFFRSNPSWEMRSYSNWALPNIYYADLTIFFSLWLVIDCRSYRKKLQKATENSLIEDSPNKIKKDLFGRMDFARKVAFRINATTPDSSFAIAITGEWGSGKTVFMNQLKEILEQNSKENIIVEFNVWKIGKTENIIDDFFNTIAENLKAYNKNASEKLREYSKKILQPSKEMHYKLLDTLIGVDFSDDSLDKRFKNINQAILNTGKRLIILIDDLDRVTSKEALDILNLIRNTANFSNTFFIVPIDQEYIIDVLKKSNITNEEGYLKKIFQWSIFLPKINKSIIKQELKEMLHRELQNSEELGKILSILSNDYEVFKQNLGLTKIEDDILFSALKNIRDLNKFTNSFRLVYDILQIEVEKVDLILLELIKVGWFDIYVRLSNRKFLKIKEDSYDYELDEEQLNKFIEDRKWDPVQISAARNILEELFNSTNKGLRRFSNPNNFYLYFSYHLFDLISISEFNSTMEKDPAFIVSKFELWGVNPKSLIELNQILSNVELNIDLYLLKKLVKTYSMSSESLNFRHRIDELLLDPKKFPSLSNLEVFVKDLLDDSEISLYKRAHLFYTFKIKSLNQEHEILLHKSELDKKMLRLFKEYLREDVQVVDAYEFCVLNIESKNVLKNSYVLNDKACRLFKEFLIKGNNMEQFVKIAIRPWSTPIRESWGFSPHVTQILGSKDEFITTVAELSIKNESVIKIKQMILDKKEFLDSKDPIFILKGSELTFMTDFWKSQDYK